MAKTNQINVKVNNPTNEAIEEFAEKYDYTKAEACRRMIEDRLSGEGYLDQSRPVPDGGEIKAQLDGLGQQVGELDQQLTEVDHDLDHHLQNLDKEIDETKNQISRTREKFSILYISLVGLIVWAISVLTYDLSIYVSGGTGALLVLWMVFMYTQLHLEEAP